MALAWMTAALLSGVLAQASAQDISLQRQVESARVAQSLFLDPGKQLGFDEAREQTFQPFNGLERLSFGGKVGWLRLRIERAEGDTSPLFFHIRPTLFDEITVFTPTRREAGGWVARRLGEREVLGVVPLGELAQSADVYLRFTSRIDASLLVFVGRQNELQLHERKLDAMTAVVTTLTALGFLVMLWRTFRQFSWMSASLAVLLFLIACRTWSALGYANLLLGLSPGTVAGFVAPITLASTAISGSILFLLATELFASQRWLRWLWVWSLAQAGLLVYVFWDPVEAMHLADLVRLAGLPLLAAALLGAAWRDPPSLKPLACKVAFSGLLFICTMLFFLTVQAHGSWLSPDFPRASDPFVQTLLLRSISPLIILAIAGWLFERLHQQRVQKMAEALQSSQESLDLETKRLQRQRKFTAMLAHELKNPLTVSHMALSGIEARLGSDAPLLERASTIKQSLQEIDAIIERCSEMDGFEQGQLPMTIAPFTLGHLTAMIKTGNPNERIYTLMRGIGDEALLVSDIHYLKIIFSNLLTNALKYSPADTLVELAVRAVVGVGGARTLEFCVSNEVGVAGIPSAELAFERFYRAEAARNQSGAGIGLWLSQALAHALGAEVVMRAEGSKISFSLALPYS
jgi:signal transduction histidine kinase